jgi:hypothetical protein
LKNGLTFGDAAEADNVVLIVVDVLIVNSVLGFIAKSPQAGLEAVAVNDKVSCLATSFTISFSTYPIQIFTVKAVPAVTGVFATNFIVDCVLGS